MRLREAIAHFSFETTSVEKCTFKKCGTWNCDYRAQYTYLVQFSSVAQMCLTPYNPMDCRTPGFPVHHQLPELPQTHAHWVGDAIQSSHPLLSTSPSAFSFPPSGSFLMSAFRIRWPKYWSFSFIISPSNEYSGLISFRINFENGKAKRELSIDGREKGRASCSQTVILPLGR